MKSRANWVIHGERNTNFFHRTVQIRRQRSRIRNLKDEVGNEISDQEGLVDHIRKIFINLYSSEQSDCDRTHPNVNAQIHLSNLPSDIEIKDALFSMKPLKAPGPDGFHPIFFQNAWSVLGKEVSQVIREWFGSSRVPTHLCHALICLIPKQDQPETVKQLRPISLCNTLYKLVTKVVVNRIKPLLTDWISETQNSFIKGRGPDVNLVVATEVLHSMNK